MKRRVLIVDDSETIRFHMKSILIDQGYEVREAPDGIEALERMKSFRAHVVLMDIVMPHMDGIECCRQIKQNPVYANTKVIIVSTKGEYERIKKAFAVGCDDYMIKPAKAEELLSKVKSLAEAAGHQVISIRHRLAELSSIAPTCPKLQRPKREPKATVRIGKI